MSKCDIRPELNDKIGVRMSKCDIRPEFECQNRIPNVKIRYIRPEHVSFNRNMYIRGLSQKVVDCLNRKKK